MEIFKLSDFTKGWVVGDFDPSLLKTKDFEMAVKYYKTGDKEKKHYHKIAEEITIIVEGEFKMNGSVIKKGDVMKLNPGEISEFSCIRDGSTAVIKTPSAKEDKYIIN